MGGISVERSFMKLLVVPASTMHELTMKNGNKAPKIHPLIMKSADRFVVTVRNAPNPRK
jgi:hypothetical protein